MCALRRSASWPQLVAISLIGISAAGCSADSGRFGEGFGSPSASSSHSDVTGSIPQTAPAGHVDSRPLPHVDFCDAIADSQLYVAGGDARSFDSRIFGPIRTRAVQGTVTPLWTYRASF